MKLLPILGDADASTRADRDIWSIERAEINEAFAAIAIVVARGLGLSEDVVNLEGGDVGPWPSDRRQGCSADLSLSETQSGEQVKSNRAMLSADERRLQPDLVGCVYRKPKCERIGDEVRQVYCVNLWHRCAEPDEKPAHPCLGIDEF
jgi:hypothetical protein